MTSTKLTRKFSTLIIILCLWLQGNSQTPCFPDAALPIKKEVKTAATVIVNNDDAAQLDRNIGRIITFVTIDALTDMRDFDVKVGSLMAETARTDKQLGASARSEGSTTAVEKPGFVDLLGFAIEHGAIQQAVQGTTLTLSTSPYALIIAAKGKDSDTAQAYHDYDFFNRIGASASFNISDQSQVLGSARRQQLIEWSIRLRLIGDRSARSQRFTQIWKEKIRPLIVSRSLKITGALDDIFRHPFFESIRDKVSDSIQKDIKDYLDKNRGNSVSTETKISKVEELIFCGLKQSVFDPIVKGQRGEPGGIAIDPELREKIVSEIAPSLLSTYDDAEAIRKAVDAAVNEINKTPLLTFVYNNQRVADGSDYSVFKLLFEQSVWNPMKMVANAGFSVYNKPDPMKNQQSVRDIFAALSFEGKTNSPFLEGTADLSKITYSFNGRYQRLRENEGVSGKKADIAVAQFKLEIPIKIGVSIPLSFTVANATELIKEKHVRGNFGITFDVDKLFALTRRAVNQ